MLEGLAIGIALGFLAGFFVVHYHYYGKRVRLFASILNDYMRLLLDLEKQDLPGGWLAIHRERFQDKWRELAKFFPTTPPRSANES